MMERVYSVIFTTSNPNSKIQNHYTDSPALQSNLLLGSLHLVFWLFVHPSAWRNHIAKIDATLRPDFTLAELNRRQWRNPALRRLLVQGYVIWPLLLGSLAVVEAWQGQQSEVNAIVSLALGLAIVLVGSLAVGAVIGVAVGMTFSATALLVSLIGGRVLTLSANLGEFTGEAILLAIWAGLMGYVAGSIVDKRANASAIRQVGSVIIGVLISSLLLNLVMGVTAGIGNLTRSGPAFVATTGVVFTLIVAVVFGAAIKWRTGNWYRGLMGSLVALVVVGLGGGALLSTAAANVEIENLFLALIGAALGIAIGFLFCVLFALPYLLAERIAGPWAGAAAGILGSSGVYIVFSIRMGGYSISPALPLSVGIMLLSLGFGWWRPVLLYPLTAAWNLLLYRADERRANKGWHGDQLSFLRWHSAFWDEFQRLPLTGLDDHLVLVAGRNPAEGQEAIEYLATSRQRWAAQAAQVELDARALAAPADVAAIGQAHRSLEARGLAGSTSALLRSFSRLSQDVAAALHQESSYNQRLALSAVEDRLDALLRELTRSDERYAARYRPIAARWRQLVADHIRALTEAVEERQEIDNPYIIGVPLTEQQEIFVGRADISARIEQLLLDRRHPPLLLYGQRRMGKTSLLNNLGRLLPGTIVPLFVDLQGPASRASDEAGFLYNIARSIVTSAQRGRHLTFPPLTREALAGDPFTCFDEWLDELERILEAEGGRTALLALDEFETLEAPLAEGRFSETALLGMFRHIIQHRPRFKVLLTGSHTLDEFQRWSSYLINVQTLHIGYLNEAEARQLVERPVQDFALRYEPEACRRVLELTRGHPALLQLLCAEVVARKNEGPPTTRRLATLADVEAAVPEALAHGGFFFADIARNQVDEAGLALLRFMAAQGEGVIVSREAMAQVCEPPDALDRTLALLSRRELIEVAEGGYRFQVELIRWWFETGKV